MQAATPRCQATRYEQPPDRPHTNFGLRGGTLAGPEVEFVCYRPMRYRASNNEWVCECGSTETGELLGAWFSAHWVVA